jgi:hypothetical protein
MKTYELFGAALDWAVAKCENFVTGNLHDGNDIGFILEKGYTPSTDWSQGGPIIEREKISIALDEEEPWCAFKEEDTDIQSFYSGPTPLIAAMRCYVASKLGDEVDVPEELNTV